MYVTPEIEIIELYAGDILSDSFDDGKGDNATPDDEL